LRHNTLQHTAAHCSTLQHTAAHCITLQHTATHSATERAEIVSGFIGVALTPGMWKKTNSATHCKTLQHTVIERAESKLTTLG